MCGRCINNAFTALHCCLTAANDDQNLDYTVKFISISLYILLYPLQIGMEKSERNERGCMEEANSGATGDGNDRWRFNLEQISPPPSLVRVSVPTQFS